MLWIEREGLTVRSLSGNREAVTLRWQGMDGGVMTHIFNVNTSGFTSSDPTLHGVSQHAVQLQPDVDAVLLSNPHILDTGEQMVKVAFDPADTSATSDFSILANSLPEYSTVSVRSIKSVVSMPTMQWAGSCDSRSAV